MTRKRVELNRYFIDALRYPGLDIHCRNGFDCFLQFVIGEHFIVLISGDEEFNAPGEVLFRAFTPAAVTGALVFVLARHGS